jgi:peptidoglycan/xylan/chitin deacetylase (PgdA/CDA1 family)
LRPGGYLIGSTTQFEPCTTGSLWNFKPLGFKLIVQDAGLKLLQMRPGIDGLTLIARAFLGKPKYMSKYYASESPLNEFISNQTAQVKLTNRQTAFRKLQYCGQFSFKVRKTQGLPIITYHHLLPSAAKEASRFKAGTVTNTVESFEEQMAWLHENGYSSMKLIEFENYIADRDVRSAEKRVLITFDDGYLSVARYCYPILKHYGFTAVVFLITSKQPKLPEVKVDPDELQYISKEEMVLLNDTYEWAAHTHNMHSRDEKNLPALVTQDINAITADAIKCRELLNGTRHFCFPFGGYNQSIVNALASVGFQYFYTTEKGLAYPDQNNSVHIINRLNISPYMNLQQFSNLIEQPN